MIMTDPAEKARLLRILESHGQSFLNSFTPTNVDSAKKRKTDIAQNQPRKRTKKSEAQVDDVDEEEQEEAEEEEEEWFGIEKDTLSDENPGEDSDDDSGSEFEHTDDEFTANNAESNVVVFSDPSVKKAPTVDYVSKAQMKAFMSSKISKLSESTTDPVVSKQKQAEEEEDRTNAQNDAMLHKLVHTKLLSGSMTTELDLTPAQRRKALAGRVLELTGEAKLGKGERIVRDAEKRKAAKRVREGLASKQKERNQQELEEAKNLGNYHPILKKVFEASGSTSAPRKREKGLKMGVGKFSNGSLQLTREDVNMAMGNHRGPSSSRGRGRGGKSGKRK